MNFFAGRRLRISAIDKHDLLSFLKCDSLICITLHDSYTTLLTRTGWMYSLINAFFYFRDITLVFRLTFNENAGKVCIENLQYSGN